MQPEELERSFAGKTHGPLYAFARFVVVWKKQDMYSIVVHGDIYRYTDRSGRIHRYKYLGTDKETAIRKYQHEEYSDFFSVWTHCFAEISEEENLKGEEWDSLMDE